MTDYRRTLTGRRQSWFGLKRHVKAALALPGVHPVLRAAARVAPGVPVRRLPAPSRLGEVTGESGGARYVLLHPDRCEIAKELYWGRGRRPAPEDALALDVVVALAGEADVLVDVGAYTGLFTVAATAAHPGLRAHAFEMVPAVAAALRENVRRNGVEDRVEVRECGVGTPGRAMRVPVGSGGSALPSFYSARMTFDDGVEVPFVALDALDDGPPSGAGLDPADRVVVKIDVEGAENEVLAHGQRFLRRHRPDILCEVLDGVADPEELERLLAPHGYRYYLVQDTGLRQSPRVRPDPRFRDWLLTPREPAGLHRLGIAVQPG